MTIPEPPPPSGNPETKMYAEHPYGARHKYFIKCGRILHIWALLPALCAGIVQIQRYR